MFAVEKSGLLLKRGHVWKNWKRRLFVLHNDGRLEYLDPKSMMSRGMINLCCYSVKEVTICDLPKARPSEFIIHVIPQEADIPEYFLSAESQEDMASWVECLQFACIETKKRQRLMQQGEDREVFKTDRFIKFASEDSSRSPSPSHNFPTRRVQSLVETRRIESTPSHRSFTAAFTPRLGGAEELVEEEPANETPLAPTEVSIALIAEGPVTALVTQRLIGLQVDVRAIVMNRTPEEEDEIPSAWYDPSLRAGLGDRIYGENDAPQALMGCSVLLLPSSISLSLVDAILTTAKDSGVTMVVRLSLCGAMDCFRDIQSKDQRISRAVEERGMRFMLLQYDMPYEGLLGFLSPQILVESALRENGQAATLPVYVPLQEELSLQCISLADVADACVSLLRQSEQEMLPSPLHLTGPVRMTVQESVDIINDALQLALRKQRECDQSLPEGSEGEPVRFIRCGIEDLATSPRGADDPWLRVYTRLLSNLRYAMASVNQRKDTELASNGLTLLLHRAPIGLREFLLSLDA